MALLSALFKSLRPRQWTKNLLLFAGLIFTGNMKDLRLLGRSMAGFILFCILSGVMYLVNDVRDMESDRQHPEKRHRPIASGKLSAHAALSAAFLLGVPALGLSYFLGVAFGNCALVYVILVTLYSLKFKNHVIIDLLMVALGFVVRAVAGIEAMAVNGKAPEVTPWFLACTLFLALFLAICKRRHEITLLNIRASEHRQVLEEYSTAFLDQMVAVTTTATVLSYALWSTIGTIGKFAGYRMMIYTLPFVLYGIFRYLYHVYQKEEGGAPESILLKDRPLQINILLWVISIIILIYFYKST